VAAVNKNDAARRDPWAPLQS